MKRLTICVVLAMSLSFAGLASAETSWGLRGGVTFDPDQVHVGAHVNAGELFENGYFVPNVEVGFGDHLTVVALNPELVYRFASHTRSAWRFYVGGGLGINFWNWDEDLYLHDSSDTELGLNILGGIYRRLSSGNDFFLELKLGVADSPDAKITAGLSFF